MAIQIKIKINSEELEIDLNDARELFNDLKDVFEPELDKSCPEPDEIKENGASEAFRKWCEEHPNEIFPDQPILPTLPYNPYNPYPNYPDYPIYPTYTPNSPILCFVKTE